MENALGTTLRLARKRHGWTLEFVGGKLGVSAQAVGQWERHQDEPSMSNLRAYCALLGISLDAANQGIMLPIDPANFVEQTEAQQVSTPDLPNFGPKDVPIMGATAGGDHDEDEFHLNGQIIDRARRPPGIMNVSNVFALHIIGDSMVPRYDPGDLVYCGGRIAVPGDHVVIEMKPSSGQAPGRSYVKKLVRRAGGAVECEQYNPPKTIKFSAQDVAHIHRIIPTKELLGF